MVFISIAIGSVDAQAIDTYINYLSNDTNADAAACIAATPDGNYIISGMTGGQWAMYGADGWIVKINPQGDTLWTRRVGGNGLDMLGAIIVNNNKYITVGFKSVFLSGRQGWLLAYDQSGNKLVDKTYGGALDDGLGDIIPVAGGGYLSLGTTKSYGTDSTQDVWLVKLNATFDLQWSKHFDLGVIIGDSSRNDNGNGIIPFENNKYLITANTCKLCDGTDGVAWYSVIDSAGNLVGAPHIFNKGPKNVFAGGIRPTADGGAIITGATSMIDSVYSHIPPLPPFRSEDMWIVKLNSNADTMWTKIYGQYGVYDGGWSIFQTTDGGYFMSAYSQIGDVAGSNYDYDNVWLMRLNSVGDTIKVCRWGGPQNDDLVNIIPALDGGAIGVGCYNSNSMLPAPIPGNCDMLIMKTDCNIISGINAVTDDEIILSVFPNPASDMINIQLKLNTKGNVAIELFDILGKKIAEENFYSSSGDLQVLKIDVTHINNGIYLLRTQTNNFTITSPVEIIKD